jgi:hypothetical protein
MELLPTLKQLASQNDFVSVKRIMFSVYRNNAILKTLDMYEHNRLKFHECFNMKIFTILTDEKTVPVIYSDHLKFCAQCSFRNKSSTSKCVHLVQIEIILIMSEIGILSPLLSEPIHPEALVQLF